jgi:putative ABC transport system permease protein
VFKRRRSAYDFAEEIQTHLDLEADDLRSEGLSPEAAHRRARVAFGSLPRAQESFYMRNSLAWFENLLRDIRFAARQMMRNPGFSATAIFTLALGIGANAAIFSLVNAIILRPLPYPNPEQLVGLGQWRNQTGEGYVQTGVSAPNMADIAIQKKIFQQVGYYRWSGFNITESNRPESVTGIKASVDLLPMFGVQPQVGRLFTSEEMQPGHDQVAIIGYRLWQERYGFDPGILGRTIDLDEKRYTIVGVMPVRFRFTWDQEMDVFVPLALTPNELSEAGRARSRDLQAQGRLQRGVSVKQAQSAMDTLAANLARQYPDADNGWGIKVEPLHAAYHRQMERPLLIMSGAVLFVLLIACVNVANLLLARATGRRQEIAVRVAIGANRRRLVVQLLTESVLMAAAGGALGLLLAYAGDRLLTLEMTRYHRFSVPNAGVIGIDWRVLIYAAGVTLAVGILFGLAPALTATRTDLSESLKEGGAGSTTESGRRRLRSVLVVSEMALALVLLAGAGLLVRTFLRLTQVNLGIDPTNVVTMEIDLPHYKYPTATQQTSFYRELLQRVGSTPGVKSAGLEQPGSTVFFQPEGQPPAPPGQEPSAGFNVTSPGDFSAMGIGMAAGREFLESDASDTAPVALISETVARRYWPRENPLGKYLTVLAHVYSGESAGTAQSLRIVGVVKDRRGYDLWEPRADIYVPFEQHPVSWAYLDVRTVVPPMTVVPSIREEVLTLDKEQPLTEVRLLSEMIEQTYGTLRFPMMLVWIFAALALVLSSIGIFGVMSYTVSRRTQELAIRMALGADRSTLLRLVLREGLRMTLTGVAIGLAAALALSRVMAGYVYGIKSTDPLAFATAALLLMLAALAACYIPARRAMHVDPMRALRIE